MQLTEIEIERYWRGGYIDADYVVVGDERDCTTPNLESTNSEVRQRLHHAAVELSKVTPWSYDQCYQWLKSQTFKQAFGGQVFVTYDECTTFTQDDWRKLSARLDEAFNKGVDNDAPPKRHWSDGLDRQRMHKRPHQYKQRTKYT